MRATYHPRAPNPDGIDAMTFFLFCAGCLIAGLTLLPLMPWPAIVGDTAAHFMLQYMLAAAVLVLLCVACRAGMMTAIPALVAFAVAAFHVAPLIPLDYGAPAMDGAPVKILQANLLKLNSDANRLEKLIVRENPDIIALSEVTRVFKDSFAALEKDYPAQEIIYDDKGSFGIALLSRLPVKSRQQHDFSGSGIPAVSMEIDLHGRTFNMLSIHPMNPLTDIAMRDAEFAGIQKTYAGRAENLVIAGDMNITPYAPAFRRLMSALSLQQARRHNGILGSYPAWLPGNLLRLPIDHVLAGQKFSIGRHTLGADIGSDHLPTVTVLGWKKNR